ncbi:MAG TPA: inorganic triphosphatase, partial [Achromobacter sp.]|nr:inorganic triphosphatase [Achromobacter sp.]
AAGDDHEARRGQAIAQFWAPRGASSVKLRDDMTPPQAMGAIAAECLDQICRNAAVLAEVDTEGVYRAGNSEHVHQLRVGVRRLRSAWKLFDGWIAPVPDALLQGVRTHFAAFGANRDQDVLNETVAPALLRAGMPVIPMEAAPPDEDAQTIAGGQAFQAWLLTLLEWSLDVPPVQPDTDSQTIANGTPSDAAPEPAIRLEGGMAGPIVKPTIIPMLTPEPEPQHLHKLLARRLHRWHGKVADQGTHFAALAIPARHDLRKRGKRLRYGLSFAESLLPASKLRGYRKLLSRVQDVLGEINDLAMAKDYYQSCTATHPQAWFALGWISARLEELVVEAQQAFDDLARSKPFWK